MVDIDFFPLVLSLGQRALLFFVGEGFQTRPRCAAVHWSFDTERTSAAFPKFVVLMFFNRSVFKKCRCRRFNSCKSEKSSLRADLERAISYLRKRRAGLSSHYTGFSFGHQYCRCHRLTHLPFRADQLLEKERDREIIAPLAVGQGAPQAIIRCMCVCVCMCVCHRDTVDGLSRCRLVGSCVLPGEDFFT